MAVVGGIMVPHPPLIIPEVGKGREHIIDETARSYDKAADFIKELAPETVVLVSPHSVMYSNYLHISPGYKASGNMGRFGAMQVHIEAEYDADFSSLLCELAEENNIMAGYEGQRDPSLDHGTLVPLYFVLKKYGDFNLVRCGISGLPLITHYSFGKLIQLAAERLGKRVAIIASGDLSHRLKEDGPYGFNPAGPVYDEMIMDVMERGAFRELLNFDLRLLDEAGECGHRSFIIMGGAFDGLNVDVEKYSHQDVTGVGYGVCTYRAT